MDAATTLRRARRAHGLSKRALARKAETSPAAVVMYENGSRVPTVNTLLRLLEAAGWHVELRLSPRARKPDDATAARWLREVLDLADRLPQRPAARELAYPPFGRTA
ncbi:MAG TPA: helix-turn-helix transcriptional regulator [Acidimicrobiia bacterium]|nr:helix-turn-helix transcriptional regulator [Acidimicrobiia bacterium]